MWPTLPEPAFLCSIPLLHDAPNEGAIVAGFDPVSSSVREDARAFLVRAGEPAVADHVDDQDRRDFSGLADGAPSGHAA